MTAYKFLLQLLPLLFLTGCPNNKSNDSLSHVYFYDSTLDSRLVNCVNYQKYCSVEELPFIAMQSSAPSIEDIMQRVIVSHDWMGERFEQLLAVLPSEIYTLLGSVTAIVIADNIRPSFYWTGSGAIYLDPDDLWLSNKEKASVEKDADYRQNYGDSLQYNFFHRFVLNDEAAYDYYSLSGTEERNLEDITIPMASLLFHELAHANDYMPQDKMYLIQDQQKTWQAINSLSDYQTQNKLAAEHPLQSTTLFDHAKIVYKGTTANEQQRQQSGEMLGEMMEQEGANHLYAYSTNAEDVAMLFQATMLKKTYNIDMDTAFVENPKGDDLTCSDYIVSWGMRNKIAESKTQIRAQFVAESLLPNTNFNAFFNDLTDSRFFPEQTDWCNISLSSTTKRNKTSQNTNKVIIHPHHGAIFSH